jgi:hypothetical protein
MPRLAEKIELSDRGLSSLPPGTHWDALGCVGFGCRVGRGRADYVDPER